MWRITNILLLVFLVFALTAGIYVFYVDHLSYLNWGRDDEVRTLNAEAPLDDQGRKLRTHAISVNGVISFDGWGPWTVVPVGQSAIKLSETSTEEGFIVVTASRNGKFLAEEQRSIFFRYVNNLVLRNKADGSERILFSTKTAIVTILALPHPTHPGLVAAFIDEDTNSDGKIDDSDRIKLRLFKFSELPTIDIPFEGQFRDFETYKDAAEQFSFTSTLDFDANGEIDINYDPTRFYEVEIETGSVSPALSEDVTEKLQAIIDG